MKPTQESNSHVSHLPAWKQELLRQYFASSEGQRAVTDMVRETIALTDRLRDAQVIDRKVLQERITI